MRIALLWPDANTVYQTLPLSLAILHSTIKDQGHEVRMFNLPLEGWRADSPAFRRALAAFRPDLVGISVWAVSFKSSVAAMRVAREVAPNATFICGGNYPTLNPEQAWAPGCFDYVVMGEAERTFPELVRHLAAGDRKPLETLPGLYFHTGDGRVVRNRNSFPEDLDAVSRVDWDFVQLERAFERGYMSTVIGPRRKVALFATRGCEYACNFCTAPLMNGQRLRHWSVEFVTREIRMLYERHGVRLFYFMDDNATQDRAFFKELCRGIAELGLPDLGLDLYRGVRLENLDEEMLHLMYRAGFRTATIAPESGSDRVRKLMRKDMRDEDVRRAAKMIRDAGLSVQGYFIIGFPGETAGERRESYRYIYQLGLDVFSLHKYMALPGTPTFRKLVQLGRITREHTDESHLIGEGLPNYNGDLPIDIDREIFLEYAKFYARRPWKIVHLLRMASAGGLWRSLSGTAAAAAKAALGIGEPGVATPSLREPM
jgi:radical SAM superfamily enzyme YgiQ (UPF0313 family)